MWGTSGTRCCSTCGVCAARSARRAQQHPLTRRQLSNHREEGHTLQPHPHRGGKEAAGLEHARKLGHSHLVARHEPAEQSTCRRQGWETRRPATARLPVAPTATLGHTATRRQGLVMQACAHEAQGAGDRIKRGVGISMQVLSIRSLKADVGQPRLGRPRPPQLQERGRQVGGHHVRLRQSGRQRGGRLARGRRDVEDAGGAALQAGRQEGFEARVQAQSGVVFDHPLGVRGRRLRPRLCTAAGSGVRQGSVHMATVFSQWHQLWHLQSPMP